MDRKLNLKAEKLNELTMDQLIGIVGADVARQASVVATVCEAVSLRLDLNCGRPSCGPGCTAVSEPQTHTC